MEPGSTGTPSARWLDPDGALPDLNSQQWESIANQPHVASALLTEVRMRLRLKRGRDAAENADAWMKSAKRTAIAQAYENKWREEPSTTLATASETSRRRGRPETVGARDTAGNLYVPPVTEDPDVHVRDRRTIVDAAAPRPRVRIRGSRQHPTVRAVHHAANGIVLVAPPELAAPVKRALLSATFTRRYAELCRVPVLDLVSATADKELDDIEVRQCAQALCQLLLDKETTDVVQGLVKDRGAGHSNARLRTAMKRHIHQQMQHVARTLLPMIRKR